MRDGRLQRSRRQEKLGMEAHGGTVNPRSGARWDRKNDGRTDEYLVEFKRTDNERSITIKFDDLRDVEMHAVLESRYPVLEFQLGGRDYVVLTRGDFLSRVRQIIARPVGSAALVRQSKVHGNRLSGRKPVLRRVPTEWESQGSQEDLQRDTSRAPRTLSGARNVQKLGTDKRRGVRGLGRNLRARAEDDQTEGEA